jgi:hypothetical protein
VFVFNAFPTLGILAGGPVEDPDVDPEALEGSAVEGALHAAQAPALRVAHFSHFVELLILAVAVRLPVIDLNLLCSSC